MQAELERLAADIDREPATVGLRAAELLRIARNQGDQVGVASAATLVARAKRDLRQMEAAELAIDDAIELATDVGGDILADAHMVAASIASHRSGSDDVAGHLATALRHASPEMRWKVGVQQAILAKRAGDLDGALARYHDVINDLRDRGGDRIVLARVLSNRGNVRGLRGDLGGAVEDYGDAIELFEDAGQAFAVAIVTQNMAEAVARMGDAPAALHLLDAAAARLDELGQPMFDAHTAKAEALIAVGLFSDAIEVLDPAVRSLVADGDRTGAAEAALVQAEALRLAGEPTGDVAERARRVFAEHGLDGFAAQAELEAVRGASIDSSKTGEAAAGAKRAGDLADRLESAGARRSAIDALAIAAMRALATDDHATAESFATRCEQLAAQLPFVEHRLAAVHARAAVDSHQLDAASVVATIKGVLDEFDHYRATIGSPDGRRGSALHAAGLEALGSRLVATLPDPIALLAWSEQRRCNHQRLLHTQRPMASDGRATIVHELRSVLTELRRDDTATADGSSTSAGLLERRGELERRLRESEIRGTDREPAGPSGAWSSPCADLDQNAMRAIVAGPNFDAHVGVSIDAYGDELIGVVVHGGTVRRVSLGSVEAGRQLAIGARSVLSDGAARLGSAEGDTDRYSRAIRELDRFLAPLDIPEGPVVLTLPMGLQAVPWCATSVLRSRAVTVTPTLAEWVARHDEVEIVDRPNVAALAGPRLDHSNTEVAEVLACYDVGVSAAEDLNQALHHADVVHVAAHARLRAENPLWSTIETETGPVEAHRFVGSEMRPSLVVLSTCDSAAPTGRTATAFGGFASLLVSGGVDNAIATVGALPDAADTVSVMKSFHERIAAGDRPAEALAGARADHPNSIAADGFMCWGAG